MVEYYEARALFDYTPASADELRLRAGEPVEVRIDHNGIDNDDIGEEGWLSGSDLLGNHGLFPANYVFDRRTPLNPSNTDDDHVVSSSNGKPEAGQEIEIGGGGGGGGGQPGQQQQYGRNGNDAHTPPRLEAVLPGHGYSNNVASSGRADSSTRAAPTGGCTAVTATATPAAYYKTSDRAQQGDHYLNGGAPAPGARGVLPPGKGGGPDRIVYGDRNTAAAAAYIVAPGTSLPGSSSHHNDGGSHRLQDGWFSGTDRATGAEYYYTADGQTSWVKPIAAVLGEPLAPENEIATSAQAMGGGSSVGGGGGSGGARSIENSKYVSDVFQYGGGCPCHFAMTAVGYYTPVCFRPLLRQRCYSVLLFAPRI